MVDPFSSKLDMPLCEIVESIDADHMQMARCSSRDDPSYRSISSVLRHIVKGGINSQGTEKLATAISAG